MNRVAVAVAEHLNFDVPWICDGAFQDHGAVAEGRCRLRPRTTQFIGKTRGVSNEPHAASAATGNRLDHHGEADPLGFGEHHGIALVGTLIAGYARHAGFPHYLLGAGLVAHCLDRCWRRPDEDETGIATGQRKFFVLGKQAVAGMQSILAAGLRRANNRAEVQVGLRRPRLADPHRRIGLPHMESVAISIGIDGDHAITEPSCRAHDAQCDLAAIGNENLEEGRELHFAGHGRATENCMRCGCRTSDSRQIASTSARTLRVSRGSITPSSSTRALVENTFICPSNTPMICAFMASSLSFSTGLPRRAAAASVTMAIVSAACSPPITAVLALGQEKQKRG